MKQIFTVILLFIFFNSYSQTSFQKRIISPQSQQVFSIVELQNENILVVASKASVIDSLHYANYIMLDKEGNTLFEMYDSAYNVNPFPMSLLVFNSKLVFIGFSNDSMVITERDFALNQIKRKSFYFLDSLFGNSTYNYNIADSVLIVSGAVERYYSDPQYGTYTVPFIIKLDSGYNIINKNIGFSDMFINNMNHLGDFKNVVLNSSKDKLIGVIRSPNNGMLGALVFDDTLGIDTIIDLNYPHLNNATINYFDVTNQYYVFSTLRNTYARKDLLLGIYDEQFDTIARLGFGGKTNNPNLDTNSTPATFLQNIVITCNNLYIGGTYNKYHHNDFTGNGFKSWYMIAKVGIDNKYVWKKRFGGDGYYNLVNIAPTIDGGCIANGYYYDHSIPNNQQSDIFIIKIDSNGTTTWTKNIEIPKIGISIYPNPTTDYINIISKGTLAISDLSIVDINAKQVMYKKINSQQARIDVSELSSGVYFVEGKNRAGIRFKGKFIKK